MLTFSKKCLNITLIIVKYYKIIMKLFFYSWQDVVYLFFFSIDPFGSNLIGN